jgi:transglutaminase-like putative cysteine protease
MRVLLKSFLFLFTCLWLFKFLHLPTYAQSEFDQFTTSYETTYTVDDQGSASVNQQITLINNTSKVYASSYTFIVEGKKPQNIQAISGSANFPVDIVEDNIRTKIVVTFPDAIVGRDKSRVFTINYDVENIATSNGEVWDLIIPRLAEPEKVNSQKLTVYVPSSFGNPAYISPQPRNKTLNGDTQSFYFEKDDLVKAGVVAAFGQFQVYSFHLTYHLKNPDVGLGEIDIALPPDTAYQRVYYESLSPQPKNIHLDSDGNWIATYRLKGKEQLDVEATVAVQLFAVPQEHFPQVNPKDVGHYLNSTDKWPADDPEIKQLAQTLRTPKNIYEYVVGRLNYDYNRVQENVERLGAKQALLNPDSAICTEFTDTFIAIARAAGIPAREVNGYAYTENPKIQPLSLVADVLHAWPEYWDGRMWRPVDPTWEDTTGGIDYFNKFDLSHVTFVIHGKDSVNPLPAGSYKTEGNIQKDVQVQFGKLPPAKTDSLLIQIINPKIKLPILGGKRTIHITNPGPVAQYNIPVYITGSGLTLKDLDETNIEFLAPYGATDIQVSFTSGLIPRGNDAKLTVIVGESQIDHKIPPEEIYLVGFFLIFGAVLAAILGFLGIRFIPGLLKRTKHRSKV